MRRTRTRSAHRTFTRRRRESRGRSCGPASPPRPAARSCCGTRAPDRLADRRGDVEPDEVEQRERAHRMAGAERHAGVDVARRQVGLLEQLDGREEVGEEQPVDDEAGDVGHDDGALAERLAERDRALRAASVAPARERELDELHLVHRVEDVQPAKRSATPHASPSSPTDSDEVVVARTASGPAAPRARKHLGLHVAVLGDRLDEEGGVGEAVRVRRDEHRDVPALTSPGALPQRADPLRRAARRLGGAGRAPGPRRGAPRRAARPHAIAPLPAMASRSSMRRDHSNGGFGWLASRSGHTARAPDSRRTEQCHSRVARS